MYCFVRACVRACVCVRERERERQTDRQTEYSGGYLTLLWYYGRGFHSQCVQITTSEKVFIYKKIMSDFYAGSFYFGKN